MTHGYYAEVEGTQRRVWNVEGLWRLASDLVPFEYAVERFEGFDVDAWYCGVNVPTIRSVLEHARRIEACDFTHPILLAESGAVMDGVHRICKATLQGRLTIPAVQFRPNPAPDRIEPWPP